MKMELGVSPHYLKFTRDHYTVTNRYFGTGLQNLSTPCQWPHSHTLWELVSIPYTRHLRPGFFISFTYGPLQKLHLDISQFIKNSSLSYLYSSKLLTNPGKPNRDQHSVQTLERNHYEPVTRSDLESFSCYWD